jgi:hypothetical protein
LVKETYVTFNRDLPAYERRASKQSWKRESEAYEQVLAKNKHTGRNTSNNKFADDVKLHQTIVVQVAE